MLLLGFLALAVVGCDQGSKEVAERRLAGDHPHELVAGRVDLRYTENPGVAFRSERVLPDAVRLPVIVIAGLSLFAILAVALYRRRHELSATTAGYALILGGAAGNLVDRAARGHVVDFVHVHGWPIFNVADVAIAAGALLVLAASVRSEIRDRRTRTG